MPIRFRRSVRIGPGIRFNLAKKSAGLSFGMRGMRYSVNSSGRTWRSVGVPGSGLSHVTVGSAGGGSKRGRSGRQEPQPAPPSAAQIDRAIPGTGWFASGAEKAFRAGMVAFAGGDNEAAADHFAEAEADGRNISPSLCHGLCLVHLGRYGEAVEPLERVLASPIELPDAYLGKYAQGIALALEVQIAPGVAVRAPFDSSGAAVMLAQVYQELERTDDALDVLEGLGEAGLDEHVIGLALADIHVARQEWDDVLELTEGVANEDDATAAMLGYRGLALLERGLATAALDVLRDALRSRARDGEILAQARYLRGRAYEELGQMGRARNDYERVLAIDHNHDDAAAGLQRVTVSS